MNILEAHSIDMYDPSDYHQGIVQGKTGDENTKGYSCLETHNEAYGNNLDK